MVTKTHTLSDILDTMSVDIQKGASTTIAADNALKVVKAEKLTQAIWEEIGHWALVNRWRRRVHGLRGVHFRNNELKNDRLANPGAVMEGIFDEPYHVNDKWVNLGDFTQADCNAMVAFYTQSISDDNRKRKFFTLAGKGLENSQIISKRYSEEDIYALIQESKA